MEHLTISKKYAWRNGLCLFAFSVAIFFIVQYFYKASFLSASGMVNAFVFPMIYGLTAFYTTWQTLQKTKHLSFRQIFSLSFLSMFIAGSLFMFFLYLYFNLFNPEAITSLREPMLNNLALKASTDDTAFLINGIKSQHFMSGKMLFLLLLCPIMIPFYAMVSLLIGLFFKKR